MNPITLDGYIDTAPLHESHTPAVHFHLIALPDRPEESATGPDSCATVFACTTDSPATAELLLHQVQLGDLLRVFGTVTQPETRRSPPHLRVDTAEILDAPPLASLGGTVLERYGTYLLVFDADRDEVPVFTTTGHWVGAAATPAAIGHLIHAFENTNQA